MEELMDVCDGCDNGFGNGGGKVVIMDDVSNDVMN